MTDVLPAIEAERSQADRIGRAGRLSRRWNDFVGKSGIDTRLLGLLVALVAIWIGFDVVSSGKFITARNLWNLSVQSVSIAVMATGMVLIIVTRNIDLSVGSLLGFLGYTMALLQTQGKISVLGLNLTISSFQSHQWYTWVVALALGLALGALVGFAQGSLVAYVGVPSFIVTLGGYLAWRGLIFRTGGTKGQTLGPLDNTFRYLGGAPERSLGAAKTWIVVAVACAGLVVSIVLARRRRVQHGLDTRPKSMDIGFAVGGSVVIIVGVSLVAMKYKAPVSNQAVGLAYPVLILIVVTMLMTYLAKRRRFGRYVYAYGGNPEAAELGGINTRRTVMYTYVVMGMLCAVSGAIQTARLNSATTNLGVQNELDVIAAAVIGGTSFSGGLGTIPGAVVGAVVMQSLRSGMSLLNIDSPSQDIVVGVVLVTAVAVDALLRLRNRRGVLGVLLGGVVVAAWVIQTGRP
jgi:D-xylose transport system permease protein